MSEGERFYAELPTFDDFAGVAEPVHFRPAPDDWLVVITDVRGSTKAIEAGRYKDVNALGVASIVALRNAMGELPIPFVFGGDGATLLVPGSRREAAHAALRGIRRMAAEAFGMEMRVGIVPVAELRRDGFDLSVARYRASEHVDLAMLSGPGFTEAERRIKDPGESQRYTVDDEGEILADFDGFECRWRPIPSQRGAVVSLLVQALHRGDRAEATYARILSGLNDILAEAAPGRPVAPATLRLQRFGDPFDQEARIRAGRRSGPLYWWRTFVAKLSAFIGSLLLSRKTNALGFPGAVYRDEVTVNTDFRKFDDMLRMVIDVNPRQRQALEALLAEEHENGTIVFGLHDAPTSIMTCAINDYAGEHVHFVDGSDGGYALAAKQMKRQLAASQSPDAAED